MRNQFFFVRLLQAVEIYVHFEKEEYKKVQQLSIVPGNEIVSYLRGMFFFCCCCILTTANLYYRSCENQVWPPSSPGMSNLSNRIILTRIRIEFVYAFFVKTESRIESETPFFEKPNLDSNPNFHFLKNRISNRIFFVEFRIELEFEPN